ncbi:MAG: hypothetical protein H7A44_06970 [Opitutaceae bacterium]|nr:hypothetical protein [Cephaloticoccus sp.]MCP5530165.1 hypothetical protein [Opitutaceae bacterium]
MNVSRFLLLFLCTAASLVAFELQRYPLADEIVLGTITAEVTPARALRLKAPATGQLHLNLPPTNRPLAKGTVWAELDPAQLDLQRRAVALARALLEAKEEPALRLEQVRTRADLTERLDEIERQSAMLRKLLKEPELGELYLADQAATGGADKVRYMLTQLDQQARLLREVLTFVGTPKQEKLELQALRLKLEQQEIDLERRERDSRLTMPFDGELTLVPPLPPAGEPLYIESGMDLARIQDFSRVDARAVIKRTEWRLLDPSRVRLRVDAGREVLFADFSRALTEEIFGREELVYYFTFRAEQKTAARALVGGQISVQLLANLPQAARLVPKLDLALADPELLRTAGWDAAVAQLIPGARVALSGDTHLAIVVQP